MKNYKMILQYDGSKYKGWQKQKNVENTIQGKIERVLNKMVQDNVEVVGSGRTDAGVHALGQVANFKIKTNKNTDEIKTYLNNYLPTDILVTNLEEVDLRFHSRLNSKSKTYLYRLCIEDKSNVFERKYVYSKKLDLNLNKMKEAATYLVGTYDFIAFSSLKKSKKSTIRTINYIDIIEKEKEKEINFIFNGNGFLYNMVRIITGTLINIGSGINSPDYIKEIIASKNRQLAGQTISPQGLTLLNVEY